MTDTTDSARAPILTAVTGGFAMTLAMYAAWLGANTIALGLHAQTAGREVVIGVALLAGLVTAVVYGRRLGAGATWPVGLGAGVLSGILSVVAIGSVLGSQPRTTDALVESGAAVGGSGAALWIGTVIASAVVGGVGVLVGGKLARDATPLPGRERVLAWLAIVAAWSVLPALVLGGFVTSTESGLAVPDSVRSYGVISVLFPNSLMSEPRIFLEHSHRLAGTLAGMHALGLVVAAFVVIPPKRWIALGAGVPIMAGGAGGVALTWSAAVPETVGIALLGVAGVGALGFAHAGIGRGVAAMAAVGALCLVWTQGMFGIARVSEQLTWVAIIHGVYGQIVFATVAMAGALFVYFARPPETPARASAANLRGLRTLALLAVITTTLQAGLGALVRHADGGSGSMHAIITHAVFSLAVVILVLLTAFKCQKCAADDGAARGLRPIGTSLVVIIGVQFAIGWLALWATQTGGEGHRPVPTADELADAHPIDLTEALITTAHQTGGALLLAGCALALFWARRLGRAIATAG